MIVTRDGMDFIEGQEIGSQAEYVARPTWPGGSSGVTIAIGYDLGYANVQQVAQDFASLPIMTIRRLQSYVGRTGQAAATLIPGARDIAIPYVTAKQVFEERDIPRSANLADQAFQNCADLPPGAFDMLVSLVFNRGAGMTDTLPNNRLEMRQIRDAMAAGDFAPIPGFIWSMRRLWLFAGPKGLVTRRGLEADRFAAALGVPLPSAASADPATPLPTPAPTPAPESDADVLMDAEIKQLGL